MSRQALTNEDVPARPPCAAIHALGAPRIRIGAGALPSLLLSVTPGIAFALGLVALATTQRFAFLASLRAWPWQMYVIAIAGFAATSAGVLDWTYHRTAGVVVGPRDRVLTLGHLVAFLAWAHLVFVEELGHG